MAKKPENKIIVVGGGLSGLMATLKICEGGGKVDLFSYCPVKRSHSLCAQGGINACMDTKGEHDSIYEHFDDTVYGGDFLADQLAVKGMVEAAPKLIKMFDRMGVPFTRTAEGVLDLRNFGGQKNKRTVFAGSTTGQQLLYALVAVACQEHRTLHLMRSIAHAHVLVHQLFIQAEQTVNAVNLVLMLGTRQLFRCQPQQIINARPHVFIT